jgi:shikimate dehydrogenase
MQNAGMAALGLDWRYLAFEVHLSDLRAAILGAQAMKFIGLNLTVPHKLLAMDIVEAFDPSARQWGAVNTIRFEARDESGQWIPLAQGSPQETPEVRSHGFNTDADAITEAIHEDLGLRASGASVLLLGAGGAGRTAALKFAAEGATALFLVNRTIEKAAGVAQEIRTRFPGVNVSVGYPKRAVDLILNATSLGLKPDDPSPLDESCFPVERAGAVYDMIYRPAETLLLKRARAAGRRTANGIGMLLHQGAAALEIWSGLPAPRDVMRRALEANVYGT